MHDAAAAAGITLAYRSFRSPEAMPLKDRWRELKQSVAANRCFADLDELINRALVWLTGMADAAR